MEDHRRQFRIGRMAKVLDVSRSGYYLWRRRKKCNRAISNERLVQAIRKSFEESKETYGSPRVTDDLKDSGIFCSENRVARLMKVNGIAVKQKCRFRVTTDSNHSYPVAANLLQQNFNTDRPNKVWVSDITYIPTRHGWQYLALIEDLFSRKVVGWSVSDRLKQELVLDAFTRALKQRNPSDGLIIHSDRGVQYASDRFRHILQRHSFKQSMSAKGNCYDNAVSESMFATFKKEIGKFGKFGTLEETKSLIFEYLEVFYNRRRKHSTLGYMSPEEFEKNFNNP
jgi:transposase InsO family protein